MSGTTNVSPHSNSSDLKVIIDMLANISAVQVQHTRMLNRMLEAATKPIDGKSAVALALEALGSSTNSQTTAIKALTGTMQNLPAQISALMKQEFDQAMTQI